MVIKHVKPSSLNSVVKMDFVPTFNTPAPSPLVISPLTNRINPSTGVINDLRRNTPVNINIPDPTTIPEQSLANTLGEVKQALSPQPNYRFNNRDKQVMIWRLPNGQNIQMYINPSNFTINEKKLISAPIRTKGGFVVQYWGEDLTRLTITGTTGSSGVKGVQVLRDIYRNEHKSFELAAIAQLGRVGDSADGTNMSDSSISGRLAAIAEDNRKNNYLLRPTMGSLAVGVKLYYQGIQYRGFFTDMNITEGTDNLGLFGYTINFVAIDTRGSRENFMAWHKEPLADDNVGMLTTGIMNALSSNPSAPRQFHPENAPLSFGGSSLTNMILSIL